MGPRTAACALVVVGCAASLVRAEGRAESRVIYLVNDGDTVHPGSDDARANTSSVPKRTTAIPAWLTTPEVWADTVACVAEVYAPFDVTVTDVDPQDVPHIAAVFGGSPLTLDLPRGIAGISPFADDCSVIEGAMVFTFTDILGGDGHAACEIMLQEIGHSYGLDHELLAGDPMSYLPYTGDRAFVDQDVSCGESTPRHCGRGTTTCSTSQNSSRASCCRRGSGSPGTVRSRAKHPPATRSRVAARPPGAPAQARRRARYVLATLRRRRSQASVASRVARRSSRRARAT